MVWRKEVSSWLIFVVDSTNLGWQWPSKCIRDRDVKSRRIKDNSQVGMVVWNIDRFSTKWVKKNLNPEWNEKFSFPLKHNNPALLHIDVWSKNWVFDGSLGSYEIPVSELEEGVADVWVKLNNCDTGRLHLGIECCRPGGKRFFYEAVTSTYYIRNIANRFRCPTFTW